MKIPIFPLVLMLPSASGFGQYDRPLTTTMRNVELVKDSPMQLIFNNAFHTYVHLSTEKPIRGLWQLTIGNFGTGVVSVDGGHLGGHRMVKTINRKQEAVFILPGCFAIFREDGANYTWDSKPPLIFEGALANKATCVVDPIQRPYTNSEWADQSNLHNELAPHAVPAWVGEDEAGVLRCVVVADRAKAQDIFAAIRKGIKEGDRPQIEAVKERVDDLERAYRDDELGQHLVQARGCTAGLNDARYFAGDANGRLFGLLLRGMTEYASWN